MIRVGAMTLKISTTPREKENERTKKESASRITTALRAARSTSAVSSTREPMRRGSYRPRRLSSTHQSGRITASAAR